MKPRNAKDALGAETIDEASRWFVEFRLGDLDSEARERFIEWLRASPANVRAYIEIAGTYAEMAPPHVQMKLDVEKLIAEARAEGPAVELPLASSRALPESRGDSRARRFTLRSPWSLAACVVLAITAGMVWYTQARDIYQTQMAEQRSITLPDGSRIDLNARTKVRVRFGSQERRVELLSGQALFQVARDTARPFVVHAQGSAIRAVGTVFDVNRGQGGPIVTVVEGRVAVSGPALRASRDAASAGAALPHESSQAAPSLHVDSSEILLSAGEQLRLSTSAPPSPRPVNVSAATAWTQHQLVFESTPLQEVIEQFNRYNARQIVIDDRALDSLRISGYYATPDPTSLLNFLRTESQIEVVESDDSIHITRR